MTSEPNCYRCGHAAVLHRKHRVVRCAAGGPPRFCPCVGYIPEAES